MTFPEHIIKSIYNASHVVIMTGAGISAESGIPTFREAQTGLWSRYNPEELATPQAFKAHPKLVWDWYTWRKEIISKSKPNPGHYAIVELEKSVKEFTLITQNIDGLHKEAGSKTLIELHGNIFRTKCQEENKFVTVESNPDQSPPVCPSCGSFLRPDVVWFSESLPSKELHSAYSAAASCDIFFSIGTSGIVQPAASLPVIAKRNKSLLIEINPNKTHLTPIMDYSFNGSAGELLPILIDQLNNLMKSGFN